MRATTEHGPILVLDQHKIAAPDFPRSPEWWARFLPDWITAEHRDGGILVLGVTGQAHPSQPPKPATLVRRNQELAAVRWLCNLPQLEPAIVQDAGERCQCWAQPARLHNGHCCFDGSRPIRICHAMPEDMRGPDLGNVLLRKCATRRTMEALEERYRKYAIRFDLNAGRDAEPTDANLAAALANCVRRPRPDEYPQIRRHVLEYRANPEEAGR